MATPSPNQHSPNPNSSMLDVIAKPGQKSKPLTEGNIYETAYKKGNLLQKLHFRFDGRLSDAIVKVKQFCAYHHLMHIHTVPFLVDLDFEMTAQNEIDPNEGIDITKE